MSSHGRVSLWSIYGVASSISLAAFGLVVFFGGRAAILPVLILAVIEITFSFENAVINSQVLARLSRFWQTIFLTVGIAIAVFGVRLILPLVLVAATTASNLPNVFNLALHHPVEYAEQLHEAYPLIAAFGGVFLLMIGLRFFGERREVRWLNSVEAPLGEFNQPWGVVIGGAMAGVGLLYMWLAPGNGRVAIAGLYGALTFVVIKGLGELLIRRSGRHSQTILHGKAAFTQFLYLELLDASFSFDGVIAAFAITKDVLLIATGLGVGALFVRSMTIHLLRQHTITRYRYLVHGAHYAILSLSIILLLGVRYEIPEVVTGGLGLLFILAAIQSSTRYQSEKK